MLQMLRDIDMSCGFWKTSNAGNMVGIPKCCKCCRILKGVVESERRSNVGDVVEISKC